MIKGVKIEEKMQEMNPNNLMYFRLANSNNLNKIENQLKEDPILGVQILDLVHKMDNKDWDDLIDELQFMDTS